MECSLEAGHRLHTEAAISDSMEWILSRPSISESHVDEAASLRDGCEYVDNMMESIASFVLIREFMKRHGDTSEPLDPIEIMAQTHRRAVMTISGPSAKQSWPALISATMYLLEKGDGFAFGQPFRNELGEGVSERNGSIGDAFLARYIDDLEAAAATEFNRQFSLDR